MLQNQCKGTDFSPNNQKKTQKKSKICYIFLILAGFAMQKYQNLPRLKSATTNTYIIQEYL